MFVSAKRLLAKKVVYNDNYNIILPINPPPFKKFQKFDKEPPPLNKPPSRINPLPTHERSHFI